jgi:hypothetical protein
MPLVVQEGGDDSPLLQSSLHDPDLRLHTFVLQLEVCDSENIFQHFTLIFVSSINIYILDTFTILPTCVSVHILSINK